MLGQVASASIICDRPAITASRSSQERSLVLIRLSMRASARPSLLESTLDPNYGWGSILLPAQGARQLRDFVANPPPVRPNHRFVIWSSGPQNRALCADGTANGWELVLVGSNGLGPAAETWPVLAAMPMDPAHQDYLLQNLRSFSI